MAGGTFTSQNKVRPGVYINFLSEGDSLASVGDRGIASMALLLSWGDSKKVIEINAGDKLQDILGYDITDPKMLLIREALKRAKTLLLYRLNEGTKASVTLGGLVATAKYGGVRGNDIEISIIQSIDDVSKFDVKTLVDGVAVDTQTIGAIEDLVQNAWVVFSGAGVLSVTSGPLISGADGASTNQDHTDYLAAIELYEFNTIALFSEDNTLKSLYAAFVKRLRDVEGKKIQGVVEKYPESDHEGIISVKNGVILSDGTTLTAAQATAWVAGATAGAEVNQSLTYQAYDDAVDASPRYTNSQIEEALLNGEFLFTQNNGRAIVEQDINTFRSFSPTKGKQFRKNRALRVLDGIANDWKRIYETYYIGKVDNNADGRNLFRKDCIKQLELYQGINAIQNLDSQKDVEVIAGVESDAVFVGSHVQPVDSIEKIYMEVQVR